MWEAIVRNRRLSWLLVGLMGVLLLALGAVIGAVFVVWLGAHPGENASLAGPETWFGAQWGAAVALLLWLVLWASAAGGGDRILLSAAGARRIEKHHAPQLWNIVEEMTIASGLGKMPRVYIVEDDRPNAFAVGYRPGRAAVAVTSGLLKRLNRDELQGVIAHEIGHIRNLDVKFMTMAGVMLGTIVLIAEIFLRTLFYSGGGRRRRSSRGGGGGQAALILLAVAILLAILAPLCAQLLYFACSRRREYLADAMSARYTRYPEGLASALERISRSARGGGREKERTSRVLAPMYIVNPLERRSLTGLTSTHPPVEKRIAVLRSMGGRAGFADYEAAYRKVHGGKGRCIGARTLSSDESVPARGPSVDPAQARQEALERTREVGDLLAGLGGYLFIQCACGVRLKVPPDLKRSRVACPRCGREHEIPTAAAVTTALGEGLRQAGKRLGRAGPGLPAARYRRKGTGWESFKCTCGHTIQISPAFALPALNCGKCGRRYEIVDGA